jgi:hypothetical protein
MCPIWRHSWAVLIWEMNIAVGHFHLKIDRSLWLSFYQRQHEDCLVRYLWPFNISMQSQWILNDIIWLSQSFPISWHGDEQHGGCTCAFLLLAKLETTPWKLRIASNLGESITVIKWSCNMQYFFHLTPSPHQWYFVGTSERLVWLTPPSLA